MSSYTIDQSTWRIPVYHTKGWACPKCGRVYAPTHHQCDACNTKAEAEEPPK